MHWINQFWSIASAADRQSINNTNKIKDQKQHHSTWKWVDELSHKFVGKLENMFQHENEKSISINWTNDETTFSQSRLFLFSFLQLNLYLHLPFVSIRVWNFSSIWFTFKMKWTGNCSRWRWVNWNISRREKDFFCWIFKFTSLLKDYRLKGLFNFFFSSISTQLHE